MPEFAEDPKGASVPSAAIREARWQLRERAEARFRVGSSEVVCSFVCTREGEPILAVPASADNALAVGETVVLEATAGGSLDGTLQSVEAGDGLTRFESFHPGVELASLRRLALRGGTLADGTPFSADDWRLPHAAWIQREQFILDHMNEDHLREMQRMCAAFFDLPNTEPRMLAVDSEGMHLQAADRVLYLRFDRCCESVEEVAFQTIALTRRAEAELGIES